MRNRLLTSLVVLCVGVGAAACGDDDDDDSGGATTPGGHRGGRGSDDHAEHRGGGAGDDPSDTEEEAASDEPRRAPRKRRRQPMLDPDGVARLAYDLIAQRRGGFSWDPSAAGYEHRRHRRCITGSTAR